MAEPLLAAVRHCATEEPVRSLLAAPHVAAEVNKLGASGNNALGLAVWRNHAGLVEALLEAGADPDASDTESGWSPLHRALYAGQLRIAAALLRANASLAVPDWRGRTPLDLLSAELREYLQPGEGDVFSWGNGNNYTLGTGSTDVQLHPTRIESLHDQQVVAVSAAKFHSAAVSVDGRLLTWGWGRGGRLGHPEAHVHSGEGAIISPLVVSSLGRRQVAAVAAGKHHTVLCTTAGEVYTCGSNRHGQLGYAVDSQPTPRRVSALRQRVVAVAAANKHSVAVTAGGDVYTWGSNVLGQLGYGTSDSTSNAAPRLVEAMRGKPVVAAAAAKRHTLVLTASGEVYTWGHRGVSPRRVLLAGARDATSLLGAPISFHRGHSDVARPVALAICAGAAHSSALTSTGVVLTWRSADPALQVQELGSALAGKRVVSIAAGKYRTAAVTDAGDVYMWEGRSDYFPAEGRQPGSGSKKPGSGSASRARPIPGRGGSAGAGGGRMSLGAEASGGLHGGSPHGSADVQGGSYGSHSHSRRPGSWIERFARERETAGVASASAGGPSSYGAAGSAGPAELGGAMLGGGSGSKGSRMGDTFERIRPERVEGLKRAVAVAVGEKHSLAVQRWSAAQLEGMAHVPWLQAQAPAGTTAGGAAKSQAAEEDAWYQHAADGLMNGSLVSPRDDADLASPGGPAGTSWESTSEPASGLPSPCGLLPVRPSPRRERTAGPGVGVPSLQRICEEEVARRLVDPRTCLQVLEYADVAGAEVLRAYCLAVAVCNLDAVLLEAGGAFEELAPHLLAELERIFKLRLAGASASGRAGRAHPAGVRAAEPAGPAAVEGEEEAGGAAGSWAAAAGAAAAHAPLGSRLQPGRRPTAAAPWMGDEGLELMEGLGVGMTPGIVPPLPPSLAAGGSSFRDRSQADAEAASQRLQRTLQKKLQQIEHLVAKAAAGAALDSQQRCKLEARPVYLSALAALEGGMALDDVQSILRAAREAAREPDQEPQGAAAGGSSASCGAPASGSTPLLPDGSGSAAPGSSSKQAKGIQGGKHGVQRAPAAEAAAAAAAASGSSGALGSSPPASTLVPAFGFAGSAATASPAAAAPPAAAAAAALAADMPGTPDGAREQASPPLGQMRSLFGFAASDGPAAGLGARQQTGGQQLPAVARTSSGGVRPKSAAKRKGGLSMFLRGELEQAAAPPPPPPAEAGSGPVAPAAPAWGARAPAPADATSLKEILSQEQAAGSAAKAPAGVGNPGAGGVKRIATPSSGIKARPVPESPVGASSGGGPLRLSLASFMQSSPMAVQRGQGGRGTASPPPAAWGGGAAGASPPTRQHTPSFRAIQEEQEALQPPPKAHGTSPPTVQRPGLGLGLGLPPWRPPAPPAGAPASLLGTSPSGSSSLLGTSPSGRSTTFLAVPPPQQSKWYVPDDSRADTRKSFASIQTEEAAMAELAKAGFGTARVLPKPDRRTPGLPRPAKQQQQQEQQAGAGPSRGIGDSAGGSRQGQQPKREGGQRRQPTKHEEGRQQDAQHEDGRQQQQQQEQPTKHEEDQQQQQQQQQAPKQRRQPRQAKQESRQPKQQQEGGAQQSEAHAHRQRPRQPKQQQSQRGEGDRPQRPRQPKQQQGQRGEGDRPQQPRPQQDQGDRPPQARQRQDQGSRPQQPRQQQDQGNRPQQQHQPRRQPSQQGQPNQQQQRQRQPSRDQPPRQERERQLGQPDRQGAPPQQQQVPPKQPQLQQSPQTV